MTRSYVSILGVAVALLCAAGFNPLRAEDYPSRTITIVVGYPPGATTDLVARTIGEGLHEAWGQPVIIDNRPGSGSNIAAAYVARAQADGYLITVVTDATVTSNTFLYKATAFDPLKDFAPVTNAAANIICLAVSADLPVNSVKELIDYAKKNPGKLSYGSSGTGSPHHLSGELLRQKAGIDILHVPYKGGGPALNDLLGGHIPMAFVSMATALPYRSSGRIKILAVVEKTRYAPTPDIPSVGETVPGFEMSSWLAVLAPAQTPQAIVGRLNKQVAEILNTDAVKKKLGDLGLAVTASTPEALSEDIKRGLEVRGQIIKAAGIAPE